MLRIVILIYSIVLHELAHGYAAKFFGDSTPEDNGRLTLNPLPHLDLIGSIILPTLCLLLGSPVFGWAKPVPVNIYALYPHRLGKVCVSLAGVLTNVLLAVGLGAIFRVWLITSESGWLAMLSSVVLYGVSLNLILAIFNLLPVPPLDGWHIFDDVLPYSWLVFIQQNQQIILLAVLMLFPYLMFLFSPAVNAAFSLITGL